MVRAGRQGIQFKVNYMKGISDEREAVKDTIGELLNLGKYIFSGTLCLLSTMNLLLLGVSVLIVSLFQGFEAGGILILEWYVRGLIPTYVHVISSIGGPGGAIILLHGLKKKGVI